MAVSLCPVCGQILKKILINLHEELKMCPNTQCTYPFLPDHKMKITKLDSSASPKKENNSLPPSEPNPYLISDEKFDIAAFLDAQPAPDMSDHVEDLTEIIEELMTVTNQGDLGFLQ